VQPPLSGDGEKYTTHLHYVQAFSS